MLACTYFVLLLCVCQIKNIVRANDKVTSDVDPRFYLKYVLMMVIIFCYYIITYNYIYLLLYNFIIYITIFAII